MSINRTGSISRRINVREERVKGSTAGAHYAELPARAKTNSKSSPYCVPNEYIYSEIGRFLRLPVVQGVVITGSGDNPKFWFAAIDFSQNEEILPAAIPEECFQDLPELCAGTILFDVLIANGDRSKNNLFLDKSSQPPQLRLFDHEWALLGTTPGQAEGRLTGSLKDRLGIPDHCLKSLVSLQSLRNSDWIGRIKSLPNYLVEETCQDAEQYGMTPQETEIVIGFLKKRRDRLSDLLDHYHH